MSFVFRYWSQTNKQPTERGDDMLYLSFSSVLSQRNNKTIVKKLSFVVFSCCNFYGSLFTRSFYHFVKYIFMMSTLMTFYFILWVFMYYGW